MTPRQPSRLPRLRIGRIGAEIRAHARPPNAGRIKLHIRVWDIMGYHGIIWASMEDAPEMPPSGRPAGHLNGPLTARRLKESLRTAGHESGAAGGRGSTRRTHDAF